MKAFITIPFVLALAITAAGAQTTGQSQIRHIETSLNHLTVLEFGEPVTTLAVGDLDSFKAAFGGIGKNDCGGCHEKYRIKKS